MDIGDCRHLLVFGGSFDPPHLAHVQLPAWVRQQTGADLVVYVPAGQAPHKLGQQQTEAPHRLAMLELALQGIEGVIVLTDEIDRATVGEPSYTVDTLQSLHHQIGSRATMRLLIGADQLRIFDTWECPDRVVELAEPWVMIRPPDTKEALLATLPTDGARAEWGNRLIHVPAMDVSSSAVRQRVRRRQSISSVVAAAVSRYIHEQGLYLKAE